MNDGKKYHKRVDVPKGTAERPMTRQEVQEKFRMLAEPILGKTVADSLIERVENMEHVPDVSGISGFMKKT
ncbi:MAG: MmgE/PrpD family protein [Deltaproteobacteria bacterium]|nr:MmgE/PrpD family protein [Deltaproteobacteria bacterium]